jgi:hypothetical protein
MTRWLRHFALGLLVAVAALTLVVARAIVEGEAEMVKSDHAFDEGQLRTAAVHARRAATLYAPSAPHVGAAYERLIAIATGAEAAGKLDTAEAAWRAVRGAALETRHFGVPHRAELERANRSLARLQVRQAEASAALVPFKRNSRQSYERALSVLERDDQLRAPWIVALLVGFAACAAGVFQLARRALDGEGRFGGFAQARLGLILVVAGALCWALAVVSA